MAGAIVRYLGRVPPRTGASEKADQLSYRINRFSCNYFGFHTRMNQAEAFL